MLAACLGPTAMADITARLKELSDMKREGMLTDAEFASAKARVLAEPSLAGPVVVGAPVAVRTEPVNIWGTADRMGIQSLDGAQSDAADLPERVQVEKSICMREARVCGSSQRRLLAGFTLLAVVGALPPVLAIILSGRQSEEGEAQDETKAVDAYEEPNDDDAYEEPVDDEQGPVEKPGAVYDGDGYSILGILVGQYTFDAARDACSAANMTLASFSTPVEATAAQSAVAASGVSKAWTAAWRDMDRKTWGWYGYGGAVEPRVEWHVFNGGSAGCYMAALEDCDPTSHQYATDCYTCENIDFESTRHGFSVHGDGVMDMDMVSEQHPALCAAL